MPLNATRNPGCTQGDDCNSHVAHWRQKCDSGPHPSILHTRVGEDAGCRLTCLVQDWHRRTVERIGLAAVMELDPCMTSKYEQQLVFPVRFARSRPGFALPLRLAII
jgi:hypothetical protein